MANLKMENLYGAAALGALKSIGEIVAAKQVVRKIASGASDNIVLDNLEVIADVGGGVFAIVNYTQDLGYPRAGRGAEEMLGAGISQLAFRLTRTIAGKILDLDPTDNVGGSRMLPSGHRRRAPAASVVRPSVPVAGARRQFFSVT